MDQMQALQFVDVNNLGENEGMAAAEFFNKDMESGEQWVTALFSMKEEELDEGALKSPCPPPSKSGTTFQVSAPLSPPPPINLNTIKTSRKGVNSAKAQVKKNPPGELGRSDLRSRMTMVLGGGRSFLRCLHRTPRRLGTNYQELRLTAARPHSQVQHSLNTPTASRLRRKSKSSLPVLFPQTLDVVKRSKNKLLGSELQPSVSTLDFSTGSTSLSAAHDGNIKFICGKCKNQFSSKWNLTMHQQSVHEGKTFQCDKCEHQATQKGGLIRHQQSVHGGRTYSCKLCPQVYKWRVDLARHNQSAHEGLKFKCNNCSKQFSEKRVLSIHNKSVHEERKYQCGSCDHQATTKVGLTKHKQSIHEGKRYPCGKCDYKATQKGDLTRHHRSVHEKDKKYVCDLCEYKSCRKDQLKTHKQSLHEGRNFQCNTCGYQAPTKKDLIKHQFLLKCFLHMVQSLI